MIDWMTLFEFIWRKCCYKATGDKKSYDTLIFSFRQWVSVSCMQKNIRTFVKVPILHATILRNIFRLNKRTCLSFLIEKQF